MQKELFWKKCMVYLITYQAVVLITYQTVATKILCIFVV